MRANKVKKFKADKQNRPRCSDCGHFHSKKYRHPKGGGKLIRCIAISGRRCDYCKKVALYPENYTRPKNDLNVCDIHRDKSCRHCSHKQYRKKGVCDMHLCQYQKRKCMEPSNYYATYCKSHFIQINNLCWCGKIPYDWICLGVLYHRKEISRDIFRLLLSYVKGQSRSCCFHCLIKYTVK
jgi:hypothetical protein